MYRKFSTTLVAAALVLGVSGTALAATTVPGAVYSDSQAAGVNQPVAKVEAALKSAGVKDVAPNAWYAGSMAVLVEAGLLTPDEGGNLNPEADLSAGEGVAAFAKVLGIASKTDSPAQALAKAQAAGIASGDLNADTDLSRLEVARILAKALGVKATLVNSAADYPFADFAGLSGSDRGILKALYELGVFKGFEDKTFRPDAVLTKAQIAILIDRILGAR